jgi:hypothetical protein
MRRERAGLFRLEKILCSLENLNFEDYIRFLSCHLFGPVTHGQNWKGWERSGEKA